jgi:hypothetical protein
MPTVREEVKGQPLHKDTEAAKEYLAEGHRPAHSDVPLLADGDTNERRPPGDDCFTIRDEDRETYKIGPDEEMKWIRSPHFWANKAAGDPVRSFLTNNRGGRIIKNEDGSFVHCAEDLILAAVPKEAADAARKRQEADALRELTGEKMGDFRGVQASNDAMYENSERTRQDLEQSGMIGPGSPTHGMAYEAAASLYGRKGTPEVDLMEAQYRRPGQVVRMTEEYQQKITDARAIASGKTTRLAIEKQRRVFAGTGANMPRDANGRLYENRTAQTAAIRQEAARSVADAGRRE